MQETSGSDPVGAELEAVYRQGGWRAFALAAKRRGLTEGQMLAIYQERIEPAAVQSGTIKLLQGARGTKEGGSCSSN